MFSVGRGRGMMTYIVCIYASGNCAFSFFSWAGQIRNGCASVRAALDTLACTARVTNTAMGARGQVAPACGPSVCV